MNFGIDVDGVLADFTSSYVRRLAAVTGKRVDPTLLEADDFPNKWNFEHQLGFSAEDVRETWRSIKSDTDFWRALLPCPDVTEHDFEKLSDLGDDGHNLYFITARPGRLTKLQTEHWLHEWSTIYSPAVLIVDSAADKGQLVTPLKLDVIIDDRLENCNAMLDAAVVADRQTRVYIKNAPYNQTGRRPGLIEVRGIKEMLDIEA